MTIQDNVFFSLSVFQCQKIVLLGIINIYHMKTKIYFGAASLVLAISLLGSSCMGSWKVSKALYKWNEKATSNRYVNNIIFWALHFIPVYPVVLGVDYCVLNLIEFWTGSNPVALAPGQTEKQVVSKNGKQYELTATTNRLDICEIGKESEKISYVFKPEDQSWNLVVSEKTTKISEAVDEYTTRFFRPDGSSFTVYGDVNNSFAVFAMNK